jgi:hypothetical protein
VADHTIYLPDEVSRAAKDAALNLSGLLRQAVLQELERKGQKPEPGVHLVRLIQQNGIEVEGRITGELLDEDGSYQVYSTDDDRVLIYSKQKNNVIEYSIAEARTKLSAHRFPKALAALGVQPTVDL